MTRTKLGSSEAFEWHSRNLPELRLKRQKFPVRASLERGDGPLVEFKSAMASLLELVTANHIVPIVVSQPALWKPSLSETETAALWFPIATPSGSVRLPGSVLQREFKKFNASQKEITAQAGGIFVPLDVLLPKDLTVFFDDVHFTDYGSDLVAKILLPVVLTEMAKVLPK